MGEESRRQWRSGPCLPCPFYSTEDPGCLRLEELLLLQLPDHSGESFQISKGSLVVMKGKMARNLNVLQGNTVLSIAKILSSVNPYRDSTHL